METTLASAPPLWWLRAIAHVDLISPGTAGHLLGKSSDHRRQCAAAALATRTPLPDENDSEIASHGDDADFAKGLTCGRLHTMITASYGTCPPGYLSYLKRMGTRIASPATYRKLHEVFSNPIHAEAARALQRVTDPRDSLADIAVGCPSWLLRSGVLPTLRTVAHRDALLGAIELILEVCPDASQKAVAASLRDAPTSHDLSKFLENWLFRAVFPDPGLDVEGFAHIADARALAEIGRRRRNCALSHRIGILAGISTIMWCEIESVWMIVLLRRSDQQSQWELSELHGHANRPPPYLASEIARGRLAAAGVKIPQPVGVLPAKWQVLEDLSHRGFSYYFDDLDDWLPE
jgi:hypothetical protein